MLALIGFIFLVLCGVFLLFSAIALLNVMRMLHIVKWLPVITFGTIGGACLWAAAHWAPFSVQWVG